MNRVSSMLHSSFAVKILSFVGRGEWPGAKMMRLFFYADKNCKRCDLCAEICPNQNIVMGKKSVNFKWNCGLCLRCFYMCPEKAIKIRRPARFIGLESWYEIQ
jgi:MinD superfamily P-loop ATPase